MQANEIPFSLTNEQITLVIDGAPVTVSAERATHFQDIVTAVLAARAGTGSWDEVRKLATPAGSLTRWLGTESPFTVDGLQISYNGERIPASIERRIWEFANTGKSPSPLFNFWKRMLLNPSYRSVQQLFNFLKNYNIPIEEDGTFLTYKRVLDSLRDVHSGVFDNTPGRVHKINRNKVSDDPNVPCAEGFHVGALGYVQKFNTGEGKIVICRVAPENVVCVPNDEYWQKIRTCEYLVVGFYTGQPMPDTTVDASFTGEQSLYDTPPAAAYGSSTQPGGEDAPDHDFQSFAAGDDDDEDEDKDLDDDNDDDIDEDVYDEDDEDDDEEDDEDEEVFSPPHISPALAKETGNVIRDMMRVSPPEPASKRKADDSVVRRMAKMRPVQLMEQSLDNLRGYASKLKIVGASKLAGGKTALVNAIVANRGLIKRRRKKLAKRTKRAR